MKTADTTIIRHAEAWVADAPWGMEDVAVLCEARFPRSVDFTKSRRISQFIYAGGKVRKLGHALNGFTWFLAITALGAFAYGIFGAYNGFVAEFPAGRPPSAGAIQPIKP